MSVDGLDHDVFDRLVQSFDPAMVVVTTVAADERAGCLVGFHAQCSIDPPRYTVWLSKANRTTEVAARAELFAVHGLADGQHDLAELFGGDTGDDVDKFARCAWVEGPGGVPLLTHCPSHFIGRLLEVVDTGGDHVCVVLEPISAAAQPLDPLRLTGVGDFEAGHDPD